MKKIIVGICLIFLFIGCEDKNQKDFFIIQDTKQFRGDEIHIEKKPFVLVSKKERYEILFSKEPIDELTNRKTILKLIGTTAAWSDGEALTYQPSDKLTTKDMCELYDTTKCAIYALLIEEEGFKDEITFTFGAYPVANEKVMIHRINDKSIEEAMSDEYYLYIFTNLKKVDDVSFIQRVKMIKIYFRNTIK